MGFDVEVVIAEDPFQAGEDMVFVVVAFVDGVVVAEGGVEDAAFFAVGFDPGDGEVVVRAVHAREGHVIFGRIEADEDIAVGTVVVFHLVEFFGEFEFRGERGGDRVVHFAAESDGGVGIPRVAVEISTDEFVVFGPVIEGIGGGVDAHEADLAGGDIVENRFLLFVGEGDFTGGAEEADGGELRDFIRVEVGEIVGDDSGEFLGALAEFGHHFMAGGDGVVMEGFGHGEDEDFAGDVGVGEERGSRNSGGGSAGRGLEEDGGAGFIADKDVGFTVVIQVGGSNLRADAGLFIDEVGDEFGFFAGGTDELEPVEDWVGERVRIAVVAVGEAAFAGDEVHQSVAVDIG